MFLSPVLCSTTPLLCSFRVAKTPPPPGAGKELRSFSSESRLLWKSSNCIAGRNSKEPDSLDPSSLLVGAKEPKLNRDVSLIDVCLECESLDEFGAQGRWEANEFERLMAEYFR